TAQHEYSLTRQDYSTANRQITRAANHTEALSEKGKQAATTNVVTDVTEASAQRHKSANGRRW
ncbi:hypothetical protein, partial [Gilvimarinus sp. 1_MG-2023]|uniref:hypothetical protein n=1 Tax=Gilvimarinus sp. 1_MG-2023 TaxID=3062638 RepID=UPI0026E1F091